MKIGTIKHIESELHSYHETLEMIEKESNEGKPIVTVIRQLSEAVRITEAIKQVYDEIDENEKKLIILKYWTKPQTKTWEGIAQECNVSRATAFNIRDRVIKQIGEKLGWK